MNIYIAVGVSGFCANLIYHRIRCSYEKIKIDNRKKYFADSIATWRMKHNIGSYDAETFNFLYGSKLNSLQIKRIFSNKIDLAENALNYWLNMHRKDSARRLLTSNPFCLVIVIYKFLKNENIIYLERDKKRELNDIRELSKPLPRQLAIINDKV